MPADCKLKAPCQEYIVRSGLVTDFSTSDRFFETVSVSGWSVALKVAALGDLGFLAGGEIGVNGAAQKLSKLGEISRGFRKEVWKMECHYVPRASFRIHNSQMCLSEEALEDVRHLRTLGQAKAFLHTYGSHVPDREYHVGGILLRGAGVRSSGGTELSTLIETASRQLPRITASIFMSQVGGAKASGSAEKLQASTTWRKDEFSDLYMREYVRALGPSTADDDEFVQKLASDRSNWFIIDINEDAVLLPIWDIVGKEAKGRDLQSQMKLLHTAWQISCSLGLYCDSKISPELIDELKCTKKEQLLQQMQCCVLAELYGDEASVPEAHSLQPLDIAKKLRKIHLSATSSDVFKKVEHNVGALLFNVPAFEELVTYVAQSTVEGMHTAKRVLGTILSTDLQQALKEEGITLSRTIREMLELQDKHEEFSPLEVAVPPADLPRKLKGIVENFLSSPEDTSYHAPFSEAVEKVIKACISKYRCEKVEKVVKSYGFNGQGIFTGHSLTKRHVKAMIEDLVESLQQQPNQPVQLPTPGLKHSEAPYLWPSKSCYSYNGDIVVDRSLERNDVHEKMIDCIRHRVDPFSPPVTIVEGAFDFSGNWGEDDAGFGEDSSGFDTSQSGISSPFLLLVQIMRKSDLTFQMALNKLLLEQRIAGFGGVCLL